MTKAKRPVIFPATLLSTDNHKSPRHGNQKDFFHPVFFPSYLTPFSHFPPVLGSASSPVMMQVSITRCVQLIMPLLDGNSVRTVIYCRVGAGTKDPPSLSVSDASPPKPVHVQRSASSSCFFFKWRQGGWMITRAAILCAYCRARSGSCLPPSSFASCEVSSIPRSCH